MIFHSAFADHAVATISLGTPGETSPPGSIAVNPNTNTIYVNKDNASNGFYVIDGTTNNVSTITLGADEVIYVPLAVNPVTNKIYVSTYNHITGQENVVVIDGATRNVIATIPVGTYPSDIVVNPDTNKIYAGGGFNNLVVIDGATNNVITTIHMPIDFGTIGVNPVTNKIYVPPSHGNAVYVIDGTNDTIIGSIDTGDHTFNIGVNPATNRVYVQILGTAFRNPTTYVIDGSTDRVIDVMPKINPSQLGINPTTNKIYGASGTNKVNVTYGTTNNVIETIMVGNNPGGIGVNPLTNRIYVSNYGDNTVSVIDGSSVPLSTTSQLQVYTQDSFGNLLPDYYTEIYTQNGTQFDSGYTPYNFTLDNSRNYTVHMENYDKYKFNHWLDTNSTNASRTISITSDTSITAVYATIPTYPSNLTATAVSPSEIDLSWNMPASDGGSPITGYRVQSSTDDSTWTTISKNTGSTGTTYSDTGLSPDTTYYYRVFALNSVGSSYRSNISYATTPILDVAGTNIGSVNATLP